MDDNAVYDRYRKSARARIAAAFDKFDGSRAWRTNMPMKKSIVGAAIIGAAIIIIPRIC
jgi:hypothetical protein